MWLFRYCCAFSQRFVGGGYQVYVGSQRGTGRDDVTGEWRRLHNEELNGLYSSPNIVGVIKSRRMRWAGHVALMGVERGGV